MRLQFVAILKLEGTKNSIRIRIFYLINKLFKSILGKCIV